MEKANQYLSIGHYSPLTIRNYLTELRFIFVYYSDVDPMDFTEDMLMGYLLYLSKTLGCSRVKCKMAAQSISFFMRIKIVQGKGAKDRYTIMSQRVLLELRAYYLIYKPKEYLFNGYRPGKRYSVRSIQHLMQKALLKVGLENKNYTIHTIRHSFATHLLDNGTDLYTIKELLGHTNLQTTMRYMHLTSRRIDEITNPYDALLTAKDNNIIKPGLK